MLKWRISLWPHYQTWTGGERGRRYLWRRPYEWHRRSDHLQKSWLQTTLWRERERERVGEQVELISMLQRTQNINQHTIHIGNLFVHIHNTQWHCLQHTTSHKLHHACIMGQCFWQASVSQSSFSPHGHWSGYSLVLSSTMTEKHSALMCDLYFIYFYISYISYIYIFLKRDFYFIYNQVVHLSLSHFN